MMRMTAKVFGVLCAASLVFCAACDNMGESLYRYVGDKTEKHEDSSTVTYDVGTIVEFEGKDYLVAKNTVAGSGNAVENAAVKYYPNPRADAYRDQLLAEQGMTEYVVLFDTAVAETATTYRDDTYMILHGGKKCYRIRYRWEDWLVFPNMGSSSEEKAERLRLFNEIPVTNLRQDYDPTAVVIDNYKAVYGSDLSKKIFDLYAFNYGANGKSVAYTAANFREIESYKNYTQINGKERNQYSFSDRIASNAHSYKLRNPNLDTATYFFEFRVDFEGDMKTPKSYRLIANGTGTKEGSASSSLYQQVLNITKVTYDSSLDKVRIESPVNVDVEAGFENRFVSVSSEKTVVGGFNVPKTITFSAPFEDSSAPLNAYTKVTFVPEAKNGGVIYVPKTDSTYPYDFLAQFVKDYQRLFGTVLLQPDSDIESDTGISCFTFSGDSLKIELESMATSGFDITMDSAASGGKSGKLVDENSRAAAIITFPAGTYTGYAVIRAPGSDNDAFYVKFGDNYIRIYADDPPPVGYAHTSRTPINLSCDKEVTVRMTILKDSPDKPGETGMFIDYVEFTKIGSQAGQGGSEDNSKVTYEVGAIVTMSSGNTYLVTKNFEVAGGSAAEGTVTTDWWTYYQNESAAAYRGKLLAECGVTAYVELFDLSSSKSDDKLDDRYMILCDRKHYYTITQSWVKANMPAEGEAAFADMTENGLREQYDPNVVLFYNEVSDFGTDLSKKVYKKYTFAYNDYNRVRFSDDNMTQFEENKAYRWINGGTQWRGSYSVVTKKENDGREKKSYNLKEGRVNKSFAYFDRYSDGTYRIGCKGEGTVGGDTSDQLYQELITIKKLQYNADAPMGEINYSVSITKNGEKKAENYATFDPNEHNCLEVSDATVTVSGITVPATITFIARYEDTAAPLGKYTRLIFEPQAKDDKVVVYEPKTDGDYDYDFVRQFIDDYQSLYAGAFPSL